MSGETERSLRWAIRNGAAHAVMLGCGEAYLGPFAVFLGAGELEIGLLATLPLLAGAFAQMGAVRLLDGRRSRRTLSSGIAAAQALTWAPIAALPYFFPAHGPLLLLAAALLYFGVGNLLPPVWNSWIGDVVPPQRRGGYFGAHARAANFFMLVGFLGAAVALEFGREWPAFASIFTAALLMRMASAGALLKVHHPPYAPPDPADHFTLWDFLRRTPKSNFAKFTLFVAAIHGTSFLAAPYFTPFMLRDLDYGYAEFLAAGAVFIVAQVLTMHRWGRLCDRIGARRILKLTALAIPLIPLLWLVSGRLAWILAIQIFSGVVWGGFNLASVSFIFDAVSPPKRARCVAYYHLLIHSAMLAGAMGGALLAPRIDGGWIGLAHPLHALFLVSGLARVLPVLLMLPLIREVKPVEPARTWNVIFEVVGLRPLRGLRLGVISSVDEEPPKPTPP